MAKDETKGKKKSGKPKVDGKTKGRVAQGTARADEAVARCPAAIRSSGSAYPRTYDRGMARATRWSEAGWLPGQACADSWAPGEDPDACAVEVLFVADTGDSYVVFALGPSPRAAVAAAEDEARRWLGCGNATDWRAA